MNKPVISSEESPAVIGHFLLPTVKLRIILAVLFSLLFIALSVSLGALSVHKFIAAFSRSEEIVSGLIYAINMAVISLATFELGLSVGKEYTQDNDDNIYTTVRSSITRFVGVVCIALVLEGLIMVIKYSQMELAGNLVYPVAIIVSASFLLIALGMFLFLTRGFELPISERKIADKDSIAPEYNRM